MYTNRLVLLAHAVFLLLAAGSCKKNTSVASEPVIPGISDFFPKTGSVDSVVTITGNNFSDDKTLVTIKFGGVAVTDIITAAVDKLVVKVPGKVAAGNVKLSVTIADVETAAAQEFLFVPATWSKLFGAVDYDAAEKVGRAADGGYVTVGETYNNTQGDADVLIIKTNAEGNKLWARTFGGTLTDVATGFVFAPDGSIMVTAYTASNNTGDVGVNHGGYDIWVLKLDANGNLLWQKTFGGSGHELSPAITATNDGNFVFTAYTFSKNSGDVGGNNGFYDFWIVKINSSGAILWNNTFGGSGFDEPRSILSQADGSLVVAGNTTSNNTGDVGPTNGYADLWIIKLDAAGKLVWKKSFGGAGTEYASSIMSNADGGYVVAGKTSSNNNGDVGASHGGYDMWILKLSADGNLQWQKTYGGSNDECAYALCPGAGGSLVIAGTTTSNNTGDVGPAHGEGDVWLIKLSANGDLLGKMVKGGADDDVVMGITQYPGEGYVISGYTISNNTGDVGVSNGDWDVWLFKINEF